MDKGVNAPLHNEINHSIVELFIQIQLCRPHEAVMSRRVVFCVIVVKVGYAWLPVYKELVAAGTAVDPVELHVGGFGALLFYGVVFKSGSG